MKRESLKKREMKNKSDKKGEKDRLLVWRVRKNDRHLT